MCKIMCARTQLISYTKLNRLPMEHHGAAAGRCVCMRVLDMLGVGYLDFY